MLQYIMGLCTWLQRIPLCMCMCFCIHASMAASSESNAWSFLTALQLKSWYHNKIKAGGAGCDEPANISTAQRTKKTTKSQQSATKLTPKDSLTSNCSQPRHACSKDTGLSHSALQHLTSIMSACRNGDQGKMQCMQGCWESL